MGHGHKTKTSYPEALTGVVYLYKVLRGNWNPQIFYSK